MVFNPSAVNVSNRPSINTGMEQSGVVDPSRKFLSSEYRQKPTPEFSPNAETLYKIQIAGYGPQSEGRHARDYEEKKSNKYIYGNYWDPSFVVFSLATFEAQVLIQSEEKVEAALKTPFQGNEAYSSTKNLLEPDLLENNEDGNFIADGRGSLSINIIA